MTTVDRIWGNAACVERFLPWSPVLTHTRIVRRGPRPRVDGTLTGGTASVACAIILVTYVHVLKVCVHIIFVHHPAFVSREVRGVGKVRLGFPTLLGHVAGEWRRWFAVNEAEAIEIRRVCSVDGDVLVYRETSPTHRVVGVIGCCRDGNVGVVVSDIG